MATSPKPAEDTSEDENLRLIKERVAQQAETSAEPAPSILDDMDDETKALIASANEQATEIIPYQPGERNTSEEIEQSDVKMPRLKLSQAMSAVAQREDNPIPAGRWYLTQGNVDLGQVIDVVPLKMFKHRSLFRTGIGLLCRSNDMVNGIGNPGGKCDACALQRWKRNPDGSSTPPACNINYNYPVIVLPFGEDQDPSVAMLTFSRTSSDAAKELNGAKQVSLKDWNGTTYRIGRDVARNVKGTFFVAKVISSEKTSPENIELAKNYMGDTDSDSFEDDDTE